MLLNKANDQYPFSYLKTGIDNSMSYLATRLDRMREKCGSNIRNFFLFLYLVTHATRLLTQDLEFHGWCVETMNTKKCTINN